MAQGLCRSVWFEACAFSCVAKPHFSNQTIFRNLSLLLSRLQPALLWSVVIYDSVAKYKNISLSPIFCRVGRDPPGTVAPLPSVLAGPGTSYVSKLVA